MKLTSPHLQTVSRPTIIDVSNAIDDLAELKQADPDADECYVLIEADDGTGAFVQAMAVSGEPRWIVEVCNSDEAALRALREPVTRGRAVELLGHFVQGDRTMGNGAEWLDVDLNSSQKKSTPVGFVIGVLALLGAAVGIWFFSHRG